MSSLFRLIERRSATSTLANPAAWLVDFFGGGSQSKTGLNVSPDTALSLSAVYACVQVRSQTLAGLPLKLFRRDAKGAKSVALHDPRHGLLHTRPHPELTSFEFREMMNGHADLRGICYAQKIFDGAGRLRRLVPLHPDRVTPHRLRDHTVDGLRPLVFDVTNDGYGGTARLTESEILRVPNLTLDGVNGLSPIRVAKETLGLALAADEHAARTFANGTRPGGVLEHPKALGEAGMKNLRATWTGVHGGVTNSGKIAILEEGMKYHEVGLTAEDAQLLESRRFSRTEIASIYRVPIHLIGGDDKASTYASVEQFNIQFVQNCMLPLCVRWEQRLNHSLLTEEEQGEYFFAFNLAGLLRGDTASRYNAYRTGLGRAGEPGWITVNDIRELEDMDPVAGGDTLFTGGQSTDKLARATLRPLFIDALSRALRKEAKAVRTIIRKPDTRAELDSFYAEHRRYLAEVLAPLADALRQLGGASLDVGALAAGMIANSRAALGPQPAEGEALEATLLAWETTRAAALTTDLLTPSESFS